MFSLANYWIRLRAIGPCDYLNIDQTAVLSYLPFSVPEEELAFTDRELPAFSESLFEETIVRYYDKRREREKNMLNFAAD